MAPVEANTIQFLRPCHHERGTRISNYPLYLAVYSHTHSHTHILYNFHTIHMKCVFLYIGTVDIMYPASTIY